MAFAINSMVDGSQQKFLSLARGRKTSLGHSQYILWATDPNRGFGALSVGKKIKKKPPGIFLVGDFFKSWLFLGRKTTDLGKIYILFSQHVGGKNKIHVKLKYQFFFLVGDNFISSEDSSPIEYTESGLSFFHLFCWTYFHYHDNFSVSEDSATIEDSLNARTFSHICIKN